MQDTPKFAYKIAEFELDSASSLLASASSLVSLDSMCFTFLASKIMQLYVHKGRLFFEAVAMCSRI